jgi:peptidylprolyl isomerase
MSTTPVHHRIFAFFMAALFIASACAFSVFVIYDMVKSRRDAADASANTANSQQAAADNCPINEPVTSVESLPVPEAFTTESVPSLDVTDLVPGDGATAKAGDCLVMKYYGTLAKDGKKFDENFTSTNALQFQLGAGRVIKGWDEGLVGLKVGGTRRVAIPASLAYGEQSPSADIPANSDLVFVVKLVKIKS